MKAMTIYLVVALVAVFLCEQARPALAQAANCDSPADHAIAFLICSWRENTARDDRQDARFDTLEDRIVALEGLLNAENLTTAEVEAIAWTKANDAMHAKQRAWANPLGVGGDPWLVNFTRQRIDRFNCFYEVLAQRTYPCPAGLIPQP